jgi:hypothetical protein
MYLDDFIENASKTINATHELHEKSTQKLLPLKSMQSPNGIENFTEKVIKKEFSYKIAGVDSGFVSKKLSFMDLVLVRTVGAIFSFKSSILEKAEYYPSAVQLPEPVLLKNGLEKDEEQQSISLVRLQKEVQASIDIIEKYSPKYLFIDGSIIPQYQDKPRKESKISDEYNSVIGLFQKLYETAEKKECTLISCIEDSRGNRFKQLLELFLETKPIANQIKLNGANDSALLDYFLLNGERTFCFPYTSNIQHHAVLKDYDEKWGKNIKVFYLKASDFDRPLRVEFISKGEPKKEADEIASIVYSLSSIHREYSYPTILIEADLRARLNEQDISIVYDKLVDKLGPKVRMRRNNRPFK